MISKNREMFRLRKINPDCKVFVRTPRPNLSSVSHWQDGVNFHIVVTFNLAIHAVMQGVPAASDHADG